MRGWDWGEVGGVWRVPQNQRQKCNPKTMDSKRQKHWSVQLTHCPESCNEKKGGMEGRTYPDSPCLNTAPIADKALRFTEYGVVE